MNWLQRLGSYFDVNRGDVIRAEQLRLTTTARTEVAPREHYELLKSYYQNNALYELLNRALSQAGIYSSSMKPIRNPTMRIVEFYPAHLWPGTLPEALPIETDNTRLPEAIEQVWTWSNWNSKKQLAARFLAIYGDLFIKVAQNDEADRVFMQVLDPGDVTDFDVDHRGFITYLRLDTFVAKRFGDTSPVQIVTEIWDKGLDSFRRWRNQTSTLPRVQELGEPELERSLTADFGIDFVPVVHAKFRDVGNLRGEAAILPLLDKIDEVNRQATRLAQIMFRYNKATWAILAGGLDSAGRPQPPPKLARRNDADPTKVDLNDDEIWEFPGLASMEALVPDLKYDAFLAMVDATMKEIEQDAPELTYFRLSDHADLSGRAVRFMLGPAIKRAEEVRGYGEFAMVRAHQMAITIAQHAGLGNFAAVGTYEEGKLDHRFKERDVIPISEEEKSAIDQVQVNTAAIKLEKLGVSRLQVLDELGYDEKAVELMDEQRARENELPTGEQ